MEKEFGDIDLPIPPHMQAWNRSSLLADIPLENGAFESEKDQLYKAWIGLTWRITFGGIPIEGRLIKIENNAFANQGDYGSPAFTIRTRDARGFPVEVRAHIRWFELVETTKDSTSTDTTDGQ